MLRLIGVEFVKTFTKLRTYLGFGAVLTIVLLFMLAAGTASPERLLTSTPALRLVRQYFVLIGNLVNTFFLSHMILNLMWVHIPFLIALVAGDLIAGEAAAGTLRMTLVWQHSRPRVLLAKFVVAIIYCTALTAFFGILCLGLGALVVGVGDLLVVTGGIAVYTPSEALLRFVLAYGLAAVGMVVVAALSLFFSSLVANAIGPIIGTMAVVIISVLISQTPIPLFERISPFLFTSYSGFWRLAFESPIDWTGIVDSGLRLLAFIFVFYAATYFIFTRKDVLT